MKQAVFFDFDSTITTPIKLERFRRHAVADQPVVFARMSSEEIVSNFGGKVRIERLATLFKRLVESGVELFIVSMGFRECIMPHLHAVGLLKYFSRDNIFGRDSEGFQQFNCVKGDLIAEIIDAKGWTAKQALYVDDSVHHVRSAAASMTCDILKVAGRGLSASEMEAVLQLSAPQKMGFRRSLGSKAKLESSPKHHPAQKRNGRTNGQEPDCQFMTDGQSTSEGSSSDLHSDQQSVCEIFASTESTRCHSVPTRGSGANGSAPARIRQEQGDCVIEGCCRTVSRNQLHGFMSGSGWKLSSWQDGMLGELNVDVWRVDVQASAVRGEADQRGSSQRKSFRSLPKPQGMSIRQRPCAEARRGTGSASSLPRC